MPCIEGASDVLSSSGAGEDVIEHSRAVADVARRMSALHPAVNEALVNAGALLHDIGRVRTHDIRHGLEGAKMLFEFGCEKELVLIAERHIGAGLTADEALELGLPAYDFLPQTMEEKIVTHADNLVRGNKYAGIRECLRRARSRFSPSSVKRLIELHFDTLPPVDVDVPVTAEDKLDNAISELDALVRVSTDTGVPVVEVSGFEAGEAADVLRDVFGNK
jgi:uncharacterized protein